MDLDKNRLMEKILLTLADDMIAPRFDLTTEILIVSAESKRTTVPPRSMLLPGPSADELCGLILKEEITTLICGGIENEHYQFLSWKKVRVIDRVIGATEDVLITFLTSELRESAVVKKMARRRGGNGEKIPKSI